VKVLVTGITGFVGKHLAQCLVELGHEVHGWGFHRSSDEVRETLGESIFKELRLGEVDITDGNSVFAHMGWIEPQFVFHLAAQAHIGHSIANPASTYNINVIGSHNVLAAAHQFEVPGVHLASSSDVYGPTSVPQISETHELRGNNPYAVSKTAMEGVGRIYWNKGMRVPVTRLFTTTGERQYTDAAISQFAWQIARMKLGVQDTVLKCRNIDNFRTLLDIDDVVVAYSRLPDVPRGDNFEDTIFNITGNDAVSLRAVISDLSLYAEVSFEIKSTPTPGDITLQAGLGDKFETATKWKPLHTPFEAARKVYDFWLNRLRNSHAM
jgi:GDP-4-dehydro-6-deoxy-D-mannose reductase